MHHSVSLKHQQCQRAAERSVFSPTLSPLTHAVCNKLQRLQAVFLHELFIMSEQIFLPLPVLNASAGPSWEDEAGYVGAGTAVRCHPLFSPAVDACLLRLSRPPLLRWISHGALCSSTTKICLKVDQSCCQRRKRNRKASEEGEQRRVFALFKMLIHAHYQKALVKRVSALFNIFATYAHIAMVV